MGLRWRQHVTALTSRPTAMERVGLATALDVAIYQSESGRSGSPGRSDRERDGSAVENDPFGGSNLQGSA